MVFRSLNSIFADDFEKSEENLQHRAVDGHRTAHRGGCTVARADGTALYWLENGGRAVGKTGHGSERGARGFGLFEPNHHRRREHSRPTG